MNVDQYKTLIAEVYEAWDRKHLADELLQANITILGLSARYDDAMKRIEDMQAELEHLRREVSRG